MKKSITLLIAIILVVGFAGCVKKPQSKNTTSTNNKAVKNAPAPKSTPSLRNAQRKAAMFQLSNSLKNYYQEMDKYPQVRSNSINKTGIFSETESTNPLLPKFAKSALEDPLNKDGYNYSYEEEMDNYLVFTKLESDEKQITEQYFCVDSHSVNHTPTLISFNPLTIGKCKKEISQQKQQELNSPLLISQLRQVKTGLNLYLDMNESLPTKLGNLYPSVIANKSILEIDGLSYAYSPASNPTKYHLGITVSNGASGLSSDDDFNSKNKDYINGFDGKDPIHDVTN